MWTRKNYFLWVEFAKANKRRFSLPISIFVLKTLVYSITDLLLVVAMLFPGILLTKSGHKISFTLGQLKEVLKGIRGLMTMLETTTNLELIDIETKDLTLKVVLR